MPARNTKYFSIGRGARKVHYMSVLIPAHSDAYDDPTWEEFDDGAITIEGGEVGYANNFPAGWPDKGAWKLNANYRFMTATQREIVSRYENGTATLYPYSDTVELANVWRIYSDRGLSDGTDPDHASWLLIYEGRQWLNPSPEAEILIGKGATITYELRDLVSETMRLVPMRLVCFWLFTLVPAPTNWGNANRYTLPTDSQWTAGGEEYTVYSQVGGIELLFYTYCRLMLAAQMLCDSVYRKHTRMAGNWDADGYCWIWRSLNADVTDHATDPATPYDFIGNLEQDPATAGDPGDVIARELRGFLGIYLAEGTSTVIGALLARGDDQGSLQSFGNLLEFLKPWTELGGCRATVDQATPDVVQVWFTPAVLAGGPRGPIDLTLDDVLVSDPEAKVNPTLAANTILAQEWGARDPRGDDEPQWRDGDGDERKFGGRLIFDTNPIADEVGKWRAAASWGTVHSYIVENFMVWKTYYMGIPLGAATPGPIRAHHQVRYPMGFPSEQLWGENSPLPELEEPTGTDDEKDATHAANIQKIRDVALANQAQGGTQAAIIGCYRSFNDPAQTIVPLKLAYPIASDTSFDFGTLGSKMTLPVDTNSDHTINALLPSDADYLDGYTGATLVNAQLDLDESTVDVKLMGREV